MTSVNRICVVDEIAVGHRNSFRYLPPATPYEMRGGKVELAAPIVMKPHQHNGQRGLNTRGDDASPSKFLWTDGRPDLNQS